MFQAVVRDNGSERVVGKRQVSGIALNEVSIGGTVLGRAVQPHDPGSGAIAVEAALRRSEVKD
jgi:hypothetical protein